VSVIILDFGRIVFVTLGEWKERTKGVVYYKLFIKMKNTIKRKIINKELRKNRCRFCNKIISGVSICGCMQSIKYAFLWDNRKRIALKRRKQQRCVI